MDATTGQTTIILWSIAIFAVSQIVLTAIMYFLSPFQTKFKDQRSRLIYSAAYTLPFAVIIGIMLGGIIRELFGDNNNMILIAGVVLVFVLLTFPNYLINKLVKMGYIRMEHKRGPKKAAVKGKRK